MPAPPPSTPHAQAPDTGAPNACAAGPEPAHAGAAARSIRARERLRQVRTGTDAPASGAAAVLALAEVLVEIDLWASGPDLAPWSTPPGPSPELVRAIVEETRLPAPYRMAYLEPVALHLERLRAIAERTGDPELLEIILSPAQQHRDGHPVEPAVRRFQSLVTTLFGQFLGSERQEQLGLPVFERLPPLVGFLSEAKLGPFTLPADLMTQLVGSPIGIVSLPWSYHARPVLWAALAHEAGGHDVLHAVPGLLPELRASIRGLFARPEFLAAHELPPSPELARQLGQAWAAWLDEAAADVFAVLNLGPMFLFGFQALLVALRRGSGPPRLPPVEISSHAGTAALDSHPPDLLRLYLAMGAISTLTRLDPRIREQAIGSAATVGQAFSEGVDHVDVSGIVTDETGTSLGVQLALPLRTMAKLSYAVGVHISTVALRSLHGRSIQDIVSWSNEDEQTAQRVQRALLSDTPPAGASTTTVLAGGLAAALTRPDLFEQVNCGMNASLDALLERDSPSRLDAGLHRAKARALHRRLTERLP